MARLKDRRKHTLACWVLSLALSAFGLAINGAAAPLQDDPRASENTPPITTGTTEIDKVIQACQSYVGSPHYWDGTSRKTFDAASLIQTCFEVVGITLPPTAQLQANFEDGHPVEEISDLQRGDLVFFSPENAPIDHVGLVETVAHDQVHFIHFSPKDNSVTSNTLVGFWWHTFARGRRISLQDTDALDALPSDALTNLQRLTAAYPDFLAPSDSTNTIFWKTDSTYMRFDDGLEDKDFETLLNQPDLEDQMRMPYLKGQRVLNEKNLDPGRVRYEPFFKKMYGATREEVASKLDTVYWLPGSLNVPLLVTRVNGVSKKLQALSLELDGLKEYHKYLTRPGGTFNWRVIAGTNRLSVHSFGIAIDISVDYANYWRWDRSKYGEDYEGYTRRIPLALVVLFEKYGFIWGGKWYHYDTMHFEYRPELLL